MTDRREFPNAVKRAAYKRANNHCQQCTALLCVGKFHYDHVNPDQMGGEPTLENCQVLCSNCHQEKTSKRDIPTIAKAKRRESRHIGAYRPRHVMPGSRRHFLKRKLDGTTVIRDTGERV